MKSKTLGLTAITLSLIAVMSMPTVFAEISPVQESIGTFTASAHAIEGTARVTTFNDWTQTISFENFKTDSGPDLYVYLATDKTASDFVSLGRLISNSGNQSYDIPAGTDPNKYTHVLIWCKSFGVLFGSSMIPEAVAIEPTAEDKEAMEKKAMMEKEAMEKKAMMEKEAMEKKAMMEKEAMEKKAMMEKEAMEKKAMMEKEAMEKDVMKKRVFFRGQLTAPAGDAPFGGEITGDYYVRVRNNEQVRVFASIDSIPNNVNLEGWLVDVDTDYKLSLGKINEKGNLVFGQRMINPWIYDVLVITEEPIGDTDPSPHKPVGGVKLQTPFGQ